MSTQPMKVVVAALATLLAACGTEPLPTPPVAPAQKGSSALETSFAEASHEFQVPIELLP